MAASSIKGTHFPSPGGGGYVGAGKLATDVDAKWDGWVEAIIALKHGEQVDGWVEEERVHLVFKTDAGEFDFQNARFDSKEDAEGGVGISVDYRDD